MGKIIKRVALCIVITIFLYSGYHLAQYLYDGYVSNKLNERMKQQYENVQKVQQDLNNVAQGELTEQQLKQQYRERFDQLLEINSDIVGWISIENTGINYPVVQSSDNDYYLNHNVEKQSSTRGSIFMDYRNKDVNEDIHTVIYGHHMKDGSMFGELSKYKDAAYYKEHNTITFEGLDGSTNWQIFSVYIYSPEDQFFEYEFADEQQYSTYLDKIIKKSRYDTGVEVTSEDQLITLVTCTYEVTDARFIIHAKRVQ
ncbi:MAG: class B sortase [Candidatus Pristimantibacillus lignocellulolyticus]|uniref:Class B sortase n=1 Tax=Candidatus Pristimantibacillus lignocellulolyticus TaxID=2994561 RepID=A0A9J6ZHL5_9BACL|nr:MAG: class B sortase [Candidatus Pristimantibacillus lignocellulolyticus]